MTILEAIKELKDYQIENIIMDIESANKDSPGILDYIGGNVLPIIPNHMIISAIKYFKGSQGYKLPPEQQIINFLGNKTKSELGNYSEQDIIRLWIKKTENMLDSLTKESKIKSEDILLKQQINQELYGLLSINEGEINEKIEAISRQIIILVLKTFSEEEIKLRNVKDIVSNNIEIVKKQFKDYMIGWYKYVQSASFIYGKLFAKKPIEDAIFVLTILSIYSYKYINRHN